MPTPFESFDELEMRVFAGERNTHRVELLLPDGERQTSNVRMPSPKSLDGLGPEEYGARLTKALFQGPVADAFWRARAVARIPTRSYASALGLRLRLWLDPSAPALHALNWECLWDPDRDEPLSASIAFSRYVRVDAPQIRAGAVGPGRMLLVVCNPSDVASLPQVIAKTVSSSSSRLWDERIRVEVVQDRATLARIQAARAEKYDLVHFLVRASGQGDGLRLYLPDENGGASPAPVETVAEALSGLAEGSPSLIFVSLTREDENTPAVGKRSDRLAPQLALAGARAAVAVEGPMSPPAAARFTETFYAELMESGVTDQAVARARRKVFGSDPSSWDWAVPALYMRSQGGALEVRQIAEAVEGTVVGVKTGKLY